MTEPTAGSAKKDYAALRALGALVASLPANESLEFREEFETVSRIWYLSLLWIANGVMKEYEDVQLTAYLSALTKSTNLLNEVSYPRRKPRLALMHIVWSRSWTSMRSSIPPTSKSDTGRDAAWERAVRADLGESGTCECRQLVVWELYFCSRAGQVACATTCS
jgi:hypothetical protein